MSRIDPTIKPKYNYSAEEIVCINCGGLLEQVGNRLFMMYKRARLPQPKSEAFICIHCGWVEGDTAFQALLQERAAKK